MRDLFDTNTGDMSLAVVEKKRGRPGKCVTEENFFDVLRYFEKQPHIQTRKEEDIKRIAWKAPSEHQTQRYIDQQLNSVSKQIVELETYITSSEVGGRNEINIYTNDRLTALKNAKASLLEKNGVEVGEWIGRLQAWVDEWVSDKEWTRCLNLAARRRADKKVRKKELTISAKVYDKLRVAKDRYQQDMTWDEFLLDMLKKHTF